MCPPILYEHNDILPKVISTFIATSFVTILIAITGLALGMIRGLKDNAIDRLVLHCLQKVSLLRMEDSTYKFWQPIMEALISTLSDQQLLVGISVLIIGFVKHCSISVYHFAVISDLAWFSSNTNLTSLAVLQVHLVENPSLRNWRVCLMLIIFILLLTAVALAGHRSWYDSWNSPAQCLFDESLGKVGGEPAIWMAVNMVLLILGYSVAIGRLFKPDEVDDILLAKPTLTMEITIANLRDKIINSISKADLTSYTTLILLLPVWMFMFCARGTFIAIAALMGSITVSLLTSMLWFAFGVWGILDDRNIPTSAMKGNENAWGFGQIVQVLLLSSTALTFKDLYSEQVKRRSRSTGKSGRTSRASKQQEGPIYEASQDSDDSELAHVTLARADTEAGGRGGGTSSTSTHNAPSGHGLVKRIPTIVEDVNSGQ
ncbi:MAG: hypothetical protein Q9205_006755 [Flavoplaca limonia]